ncbi:hypothetical protein NDU88_002576 [Pleurodeles waltl]|uniref:Uncharacterized protein n=1 Tax=Pleurodeles waltl TaxID=8319 RepID=A0AAV7TNM7_PLEWA|nr:hypothetical protein NDU88_002576 [Pleurodeles waltl]
MGARGGPSPPVWIMIGSSPEAQLRWQPAVGPSGQVCRFVLLSPRPTRSHSADRSSLGHPLGAPVPSAPGVCPAGRPPQLKCQDPAVQACALHAAASPRDSVRGVLSSPRPASLSRLSRHGPPHQAPPSRGTEAAQVDGDPSSPADAAPPPQSTGSALRSAAPAPPEPLTAPTPRGGRTKGQQLSSNLVGHVGFRLVGSR